MYQDITSYDLINLMKSKNIKLIDIRDSYIYSLGTIGNAINISLNLLITNPSDYLDKNTCYYIFCSHGNSSRSLCRYLSNKGYYVVNILGGYNSYKGSI